MGWLRMSMPEPRLNNSIIVFCRPPLPRKCSHMNVLFGSPLSTSHDPKVLPDIFLKFFSDKISSMLDIASFISSTLSFAFSESP